MLNLFHEYLSKQKKTETQQYASQLGLKRNPTLIMYWFQAITT